jgi:type II secretory pathway pseudopilin PulG
MRLMRSFGLHMQNLLPAANQSARKIAQCESAAFQSDGMMKPTPVRPVKRPAEQGYMLVAVMFLLAIMIVSMTVAAPMIKKSIQHDRELETMQRGKQYIRAIKLYYRKFGAYPPSVDALVKTNEIRFLRQRYSDPITGKDDWKPIFLGQNKTPLAMGFFGEPLSVAGSPIPGAGSIGGNGVAGNTPLGNGPGSSQNGGSIFDSGNSSSSGSGNSGGQDGASSGGAPNSGSGSNNPDQLIGGGPIIGFSPASPNQSIMIYKKMGHYKDWEFLYSPLSDRMAVNNPTIQPPLQGGAPGAPPPAAGSPAPAPNAP